MVYFDATTLVPRAIVNQDVTDIPEVDNVTVANPDSEMDRLKFEEIRSRHIEETRKYKHEAASHLHWTRDQIVAEQTFRLREMLQHAKEHSPHYEQTLANIDLSTIDATDLSSIPIMTKQDVMDNWDDVVTDRRLKLGDVTKHLDDLHTGKKGNAYYLDEYMIFATGGTSGKRGVFVWDWDMGIIQPNIQSRWEVEYDMAHPEATSSNNKRTAVICAGSYVHASRFLFPTMLDPERDVKIISAGTPLGKIVDSLNTYQPDRIVGYASIVQELAQCAINGDLDIHPKWIATNSEPLEESARAATRRAWNVDIHNSWGSVEIGLSAYEGQPSGGAHLAEDYVIVEVVDENDIAVDDPNLAHHVLVTRLYGGTMPLIRYAMTDTLILQEGKPSIGETPGVRRIERIEGRSDIWFDYKTFGVKVHPIVFRTVLGQKDPIVEYQVQQTYDGAHVLVIVKGELDVQEVVMDLRSSLKRAGLESPVVSLEVVKTLPRHPETNKLKHFVPL